MFALRGIVDGADGDTTGQGGRMMYRGTEYVYLDGRGDEPLPDEEALDLAVLTEEIIKAINTPGTPEYKFYQEMGDVMRDMDKYFDYVYKITDRAIREGKYSELS
jgi:hypothetical protein